MIITCPNCSSEYDILETALGDQGREVKCAKCGHKWFCLPDGSAKIEEETSEQAPAEEEALQEPEVEPEVSEEAEEQELEAKLEESAEEIDIPDAVKPVPEEQIKLPPQPVSIVAKMAGYGAALILFGAFIVTGFIYKNEIITAWPPAAKLYELAGTPAVYEGEGLIIESLSATVLSNKDQQDILIVKGRVVNLTDKTIDVPKIQASLRSTNGLNIEQWVIDPPVEMIAAGESFAFTSDYPNVQNNVGSVNLAFVPTLK